MKIKGFTRLFLKSPFAYYLLKSSGAPPAMLAQPTNLTVEEI